MVIMDSDCNQLLSNRILRMVMNMITEHFSNFLIYPRDSLDGHFLRAGCPLLMNDDRTNGGRCCKLGALGKTAAALYRISRIGHVMLVGERK